MVCPFYYPITSGIPRISHQDVTPRPQQGHIFVNRPITGPHCHFSFGAEEKLLEPSFPLLIQTTPKHLYRNKSKKYFNGKQIIYTVCSHVQLLYDTDLPKRPWWAEYIISCAPTSPKITHSRRDLLIQE